MPDRNQGGQHRVNLVQPEYVTAGEEQEVLLDVGETLMMRRSMIIPEKEEVPK